MAISMKRLESKSWAALRCSAGRNDLVAGREDRDADAPANLQLGQPQGRGQRHVLRSHLMAAPKHGGAGGNVLSRRAHIGAPFQSRRQRDRAGGIIDPNIFLHENRIGHRRHRRAGEDAGGVVGQQGLRRTAAGLDTPLDGEDPLAGGGQVARPDRIAVDRGVGERAAGESVR